MSAAADMRRRAAERKASLAGGSGSSSHTNVAPPSQGIETSLVEQEATPMQIERVETSAGYIVTAIPSKSPVVDGDKSEKKRRSNDSISVLKTYRPSWGVVDTDSFGAPASKSVKDITASDFIILMHLKGRKMFRIGC